MPLHPAVEDRLARLAPDQRAAATAPPGPTLCVAPAGSGKTTTLVARIAWLVATGTAPERICAITFNRRAAEELGSRLAVALEPLGLAPDAVRVRTFHALGREILRSAGAPVEPLADRTHVLRSIAPGAGPALLRRLDDAFSRLKLDLGIRAEDVALDPSPGPVARAFLAYEAELESIGGLDFDDLVARSLRLLQTSPDVLATWRASCAELLVDEAQDVDRSQLRLALLLAAPANRIFLVGDDDQTIYGWRLADVRRVLGLASELPGLRRVDLETNYRCPKPVVERAVRLVERNEERFVKRVRPGPKADGRLVLAPDGSDESNRIRLLLASWPDDGGSQAILARTNRELLPAVAVALEAEVPFRAPRVPLLFEDPRVDGLLDRAALDRDPPTSPLLVLGRLAARLDPTETDRPEDGAAISNRDLVRALLAWAVPYSDIASLRAAIDERRRRLAELRRDDARLTLATAHGTKGLEFDHVGVIGLDAGRFPSARSIQEAAEPERALQEERRLAYVAWTRAHLSLTLVYDPAAPSPFMLEAFDDAELGLEPARGPPGRHAQPGREETPSGGSRLVPGEDPQKPIDRFEERLRRVGWERVADRVAWTVRRPRPPRRGQQIANGAIAERRRDRLEKVGPARQPTFASRGEEPVGPPGGVERGLIDLGQLVPGRTGRGELPAGTTHRLRAVICQAR